MQEDKQNTQKFKQNIKNNDDDDSPKAKQLQMYLQKLNCFQSELKAKMKAYVDLKKDIQEQQKQDLVLLKKQTINYKEKDTIGVQTFIDPQFDQYYQVPFSFVTQQLQENNQRAIENLKQRLFEKIESSKEVKQNEFKHQQQENLKKRNSQLIRQNQMQKIKIENYCQKLKNTETKLQEMIINNQKLQKIIEQIKHRQQNIISQYNNKQKLLKQNLEQLNTLLQQSQKNKKKVQDNLLDHLKQIEKLKQKIDKQTFLTDDLSNNIKQLQTALKKQKVITIKLSTQTQQKNKQYQKIVQLNNTLNKKLINEKIKFEQLQKTLNSQVQSLRKNINQQKGQFINSQQIIEKRQIQQINQIQNLQKLLQVNIQQKKKSEKRIENLQQQIKELQQRQLARQRLSLQDNKKEEQLEQKINSLNLQISKLNQKINEMQIKLKNQKDKSSHLTKVNEDLSSISEKQADSIQKLIQKVKLLQKQCQETKVLSSNSKKKQQDCLKQKQQLTNENKLKSQQIQSLKSIINSIKLQVNKVKQEQIIKNLRLDEGVQKHQQLENQYTKLKTQYKELMSENKDLKEVKILNKLRQVKQLKQQNQKLNNIIQKLDDKMQDYKNDICNLESQLNSIRVQLQKYQNDDDMKSIRSLKDDLEKTDSYVNKMELRISKLQTIIEEKQQQLQKQIEQKIKYRQQVQKLCSQVLRLSQHQKQNQNVKSLNLEDLLKQIALSPLLKQRQQNIPNFHNFHGFQVDLDSVNNSKQKSQNRSSKNEQKQAKYSPRNSAFKSLSQIEQVQSNKSHKSIPQLLLKYIQEMISQPQKKTEVIQIISQLQHQIQKKQQVIQMLQKQKDKVLSNQDQKTISVREVQQQNQILKHQNQKLKKQIQQLELKMRDTNNQGFIQSTQSQALQHKNYFSQQLDQGSQHDTINNFINSQKEPQFQARKISQTHSIRLKKQNSVKNSDFSKTKKIKVPVLNLQKVQQYAKIEANKDKQIQIQPCITPKNLIKKTSNNANLQSHRQKTQNQIIGSKQIKKALSKDNNNKKDQSKSKSKSKQKSKSQQVAAQQNQCKSIYIGQVISGQNNSKSLSIKGRLFLSISEQNKHLKDQVSHLHQELSNKNQYLGKVRIFSKKWNKLRNDKEKEINLMNCVKTYQQYKQLLKQVQKKNIITNHLKQGTTNQQKKLFNQLEKVIKESVQWISLFDKLGSLEEQYQILEQQNQLNQFFKRNRKTNKINYHFGQFYERSILSQGNTPKKCIDRQFDISPCYLDLHQHPPQQTKSTLKKLFQNYGQNISISSVKGNSQKSQFINSKSDIGNFLRHPNNIHHSQRKNANANPSDLFDDYLNVPKTKKNNDKQKLQKIKAFNSHVINERNKVNQMIKKAKEEKNMFNKETLNYDKQLQNQYAKEHSTKNLRKILIKYKTKLKYLQNQNKKLKKDSKNLVDTITDSFRLKMSKMQMQFNMSIHNIMHKKSLLLLEQKLQSQSGEKGSKQNLISSSPNIQSSSPPKARSFKKQAKSSEDIYQCKQHKIINNQQLQSELLQLRNDSIQYKERINDLQKILENKKLQIQNIQKKFKNQQIIKQKLNESFCYQKSRNQDLNRSLNKFKIDFIKFMNILTKKQSEVQTINQNQKKQKQETKINLQQNKSVQKKDKQVQTENEKQLSLQERQAIQKSVKIHIFKQIGVQLFKILQNLPTKQGFESFFQPTSYQQTKLILDQLKWFSDDYNKTQQTFHKIIQSKIKSYHHIIGAIIQNNYMTKDVMQNIIRQVQKTSKQQQQNLRQLHTYIKRQFSKIKKLTSLEQQLKSPINKLEDKFNQQKVFQPPQLECMKSVQQLQLEYALQLSDLKQKNKLLVKEVAALKQQNQNLKDKNQDLIKLKKNNLKKSIPGQYKTLKKQAILDNESDQDEQFIDFKQSQFFCNLSNYNKQLQDLKNQLQKYKQKCQLYEFRQKKNNKKTHIIHIKN